MKILNSDDNGNSDTAVTDNGKPETANVSDLEKFLSDYKEPAKIENLSGEQPTTSAPVTGNSWIGNPDYYQSGKKQGQIKPKRKPLISVSGDTSSISGDIISGALFLMLINLLMPMLFAVVNNAVSKKKIDYTLLQIDDKALKQLEPVADKAIKQIKVEANPVAVLFITMAGLYTLQFFTVKMMADIKSK